MAESPEPQQPTTTEPSPAAARSRRTFWPLVLLGAGAAALAAVAASKPMIAVDRDSLSDLGISGAAIDRLEGEGVDGSLAITGAANEVVSADLPLAAALALVLLACWGVVLVTRGRVRLLVAWTTLVAAAGLLASLVAGYVMRSDDYADAFARALGTESMADRVGVHPTGWFWAALAGAVVACVASAVALRHVRHWPAMGSRYDAPGGGAKSGPVRPETASTNELWKSIDEGHDPTDGPRP